MVASNGFMTAVYWMQIYCKNPDFRGFFVLLYKYDDG